MSVFQTALAVKAKAGLPSDPLFDSIFGIDQTATLVLPAATVTSPVQPAVTPAAAKSTTAAMTSSAPKISISLLNPITPGSVRSYDGVIQFSSDTGPQTVNGTTFANLLFVSANGGADFTPLPGRGPFQPGFTSPGPDFLTLGQTGLVPVPGSYTVVVKQTNASGVVGTATAFYQVQYGATFVGAAKFGNTSATFNTGDTVHLQAVFNAPTPATVLAKTTLLLSNGGRATYDPTDISENAFVYTVKAGQATSDLKVVGIDFGGAAPMAAGGGGFLAPVTYTGGLTNAAGVATADLNGDGRPDLAVTDNMAAATVQVRLNDGKGGFGAATSYSVGAYAVGVTFADVTGDGKTDLVVTTAKDVEVLAGDGTGKFGKPVSFTTGLRPTAIVARDVTGDGRLDLIVADAGSQATLDGTVGTKKDGDIALLVSNGKGGFLPAVKLASGINPDQVAVGDVTGDGKLDIVYTSHVVGPLGALAYTVTILPGNGKGGFGPAITPLQNPIDNAALTLADLNGDGTTAIVVANTIISSDGAGGYRTDGNGYNNGVYTGVYLPSGTQSVAADVNSDGKPDLVSVGVPSGSLSQSPNPLSIAITESGPTGLGSGAGPQTALPGSKPVAVTAADLNGDGKADLITVGGNTITVLSHSDGSTQVFDPNSVKVAAGTDTGFVITDTRLTLKQQTISLTTAEGSLLGNGYQFLLDNAQGADPSNLSLSIGPYATEEGYVYSAPGVLYYVANGRNDASPIDGFDYTISSTNGQSVTGHVSITITGSVQPTLSSFGTGKTITATATGQKLISFANAQKEIGAAGGKTTIFGNVDTKITGRGDNNVIYALPGTHVIAAGANNNQVTIYGGDNTVTGTGKGNSVTTIAGSIKVSGFTGYSTLSVGNAVYQVKVTGPGNTLTSDQGGGVADLGTSSFNTVKANGGDNQIKLGGQSNLVTLGNGNDTVTATGNFNVIDAGGGRNTVTVVGDGNSITVSQSFIAGADDTSAVFLYGKSTSVHLDAAVNALTDSGAGGNTIEFGKQFGTYANTITVPSLTAETFDLRDVFALVPWNQDPATAGQYLKFVQSGKDAVLEVAGQNGVFKELATFKGLGATATVSDLLAHSQV